MIHWVKDKESGGLGHRGGGGCVGPGTYRQTPQAVDKEVDVFDHKGGDRHIGLER